MINTRACKEQERQTSLPLTNQDLPLELKVEVNFAQTSKVSQERGEIP